MKGLLEWIEKNKYFLKDTKDGKRWYSTLNRGLYDKPSPVYTHEQLIEKYEKERTYN